MLATKINLAGPLAELLKTGIPLVPALDMLAHTSSLAERTLLQAIKQRIEKGYPLSQALKKHPQHFSPMICHIVAAGEHSGTLEQMLERIADHLEKMENLSRALKKALFYPALVCTLAFCLTLFLLLWVIPNFESLFQQFQGELPWLTRAVLWTSQWIGRYGWIFVSLLVLGFYSLSLWKKDWWLSLPWLGAFIQKIILRHFIATLSTLSSAGIPFSEGVRFAAACTTCPSVLQKFSALAHKISVGMRIHQAMRSTGLFPKFALQLISIGEATGNLADMLAKISIVLEKEVTHHLNYLSSLLEPLLMLGLGIIVGSLLIAMYLPIFKLGSLF